MDQHKRVIGVITPICGAIILLMTGSDPPGQNLHVFFFPPKGDATRWGKNFTIEWPLEFNDMFVVSFVVRGGCFKACWRCGYVDKLGWCNATQERINLMQIYKFQRFPSWGWCPIPLRGCWRASGVYIFKLGERDENPGLLEIKGNYTAQLHWNYNQPAKGPS